MTPLNCLKCKLNLKSNTSSACINFYFNFKHSVLSLPISRCAEENLGQTRLSDTVEILDELIKEGYLSSTDVDFSTVETTHRSWYGTYLK